MHGTTTKIILRKSGTGRAKFTVPYSPMVKSNTFITVVMVVNTLLHAIQSCPLHRIFTFTESTIICTWVYHTSTLRFLHFILEPKTAMRNMAATRTSISERQG